MPGDNPDLEVTTFIFTELQQLDGRAEEMEEFVTNATVDPVAEEEVEMTDTDKGHFSKRTDKGHDDDVERDVQVDDSVGGLPDDIMPSFNTLGVSDAAAGSKSGRVEDDQKVQRGKKRAGVLFKLLGKVLEWMGIRTSLRKLKGSR